LAAAVADIVQLGRSVGRLDGHCPLCDTKLGEEQFQRGMLAAAARVKKSEAATSAAAAVDGANKQLRAAEVQLSKAEETARALEQGKTALSVAAREIREAFDRAGFEIGAEVTVDEMTSAIDKASAELAELERALRVLELAQTTSGAKELEEKISALKAQSDYAERRQTQAKKAVQRAKEIQKAITRTRNELLEERLASVSPLLAELYQRFSPHFNWRAIEYKLRGDVRRLLSLSVGESFNPQFIFSSGQRRVAGLAFLLSVYLSRTWSTWQTLLLDDPMQHIDDYRALNLAEVLGAMRCDGRQIICAVEDEQRGALLARHLRSSVESPGARVKLDLDAAGSLSILSWEPVEPFPIETISSVVPG
jgi:cob(I)alamin adenosyltransferase